MAFDVMIAEPDRTSPKAATELWKLRGALREQLAALPDHDSVLASSLAAGDAVVGFALERGADTDGSGGAGRKPVQKSRFINSG